MQDAAEDNKLVSLATAGDHQAFGELVLRHRAKLLGWTRSMIRDRFQAEDIVQEALSKSFAQIGGLQDSAKFLPWLRRIVRNEMLMKLRKKEHVLPGRNDEMVSMADERESLSNDPLASVIRKQTATMVTELGGVLSGREKAVFEAHILAGLEVKETADLLRMKPGAVYTYISRTRQKLQDERFRYEVRQYVEARASTGAVTEHKVSRIHPHWSYGSYNTMVWIMTELLQSLGVKRYRVTDVMGFTGHAFRLHASADLGPSSAYGYDWANIAKQGWNNLGFACRSVGRPGMAIITPEAQVQAIELIHEALERGCPVMGWNLSGIGFGLIYGFNDSKCMFTIMDTTAVDKQIPYDKLGRTSDFSELYVVTVSGQYPIPYKQMVMGALQSAFRHAVGQEPSVGAYSAGLSAYDTWIAAMQLPQTSEPFYAAMNAKSVAEARRHAAAFIRSVRASADEGGFDDSCKPHLDFLYQAYAAVSGLWDGIVSLLSAEERLSRIHDQTGRQAVELLMHAKAAETQIAETIPALIESLKKSGRKS